MYKSSRQFQILRNHSRQRQRMFRSVPEQISLFHSRLRSGRFDDSTLEILESVSFSKDVKSLMAVRSRLKELLRSETLPVIRGTAEKTDDEKLLVIEFLVRAFALIGDNESCLALRYEALNFRELRSSNQQSFQVSHVEWLSVAEHSLRAGCFSVAVKAYEHALSCLQHSDSADLTIDGSVKCMKVIEEIKRLKDHALKSAAPHSVQALTSEYLEKKVIERSRKSSSFCKESQYTASTLFRNGIRNHNARKLHEYQGVQGITSKPVLR